MEKILENVIGNYCKIDSTSIFARKNVMLNQENAFVKIHLGCYLFSLGICSTYLAVVSYKTKLDKYNRNLYNNKNN